jgi:hypothetical protein
MCTRWRSEGAISRVHVSRGARGRSCVHVAGVLVSSRIAGSVLREFGEGLLGLCGGSGEDDGALLAVPCVEAERDD